MEKPINFAGRVIRKGHREERNDYPQPNKFFNELGSFYRLLDDAPYKAIEDLEKYELNRDIVIQCIQKLLRICWAAKIDIIAEIDRLNESPFDGLEDDLALKKKKDVNIC